MSNHQYADSRPEWESEVEDPRSQVFRSPDGIVGTKFTPEEMVEIEEAVMASRAWADDLYKGRHPTDTRSTDERAEDAWQAHISGAVHFDMGVCPYCGAIPALEPSRLCCKLNRWTSYALLDWAEDQYIDPIPGAAERFGQAMTSGDSAAADEAAATLIEATQTRNLEDAFVVAGLWPTPSCGGRHCFKTPTREWHAPNWCAAVDGSARDRKAWHEGGEVGRPPKPRRVDAEPDLLEGRTNGTSKEDSERYMAEHYRQLEKLYGVERVRQAREAQEAFDAAYEDCHET